MVPLILQSKHPNPSFREHHGSILDGGGGGERRGGGVDGMIAGNKTALKGHWFCTNPPWLCSLLLH